MHKNKIKIKTEHIGPQIFKFYLDKDKIKLNII